MITGLLTLPLYLLNLFLANLPLPGGLPPPALPADLLEKASEWTAEAATVGLLLGVVVGGVLGAETIRKSLAKASSQNGLARTLMPPTKERQLVEQMED